MAFGVGDGVFRGAGCTGFITCRGHANESCAEFPCPPYDGVYACWWTSGCGRTPDYDFRLSYYTGARWELLSEHHPGTYEGYVYVRFGLSAGNCGYAYKIEFGESVGRFLVGDVPADRIPCEMWTKEMIAAEKDRMRELIAAEKSDASADVKALRSAASAEVKVIRGKANIDIAAERAEYKLISTDLRAAVKRDLVDIRDIHNDHEALLKLTYKTAKALSDDEERAEKVERSATGKIDVADEKRKEGDDIGNIRKQRDIDVAAEYHGRDEDIRGRYERRDLTYIEIKESGKPCVAL